MDIKNSIKSWLGIYPTITTVEKSLSWGDWYGTDGILSAINVGGYNILANPVLNRAINLIANNIAKLPITYWRGDTQVFNAPFDFDNPNPYQTRNEFITQLVINYVIDNEVIIQVIDKPVVGKYILIIPRGEATINTYSSGFPTSWKINNTTIPSEEIIYITNSLYKTTTTSTPTRPLRLIDVVLQDYLIDINSDKYLAAFFKNYCAIGGIFSSSNGATVPQDMMDKLVTMWNSRHMGADNAHKAAGIGGDIKYTPINSQSIKDMEMSITKDGIRDRFLLTLGVHKAVVGVTDAVDRAVADTALKSLWQLTLLPIIDTIEDKLNKYLSTQYRKDKITMEFDLSGVEELKKDKQQQITLLQSLIASGYTQSEAAEYVGLEIEPNTEIGDIRFLPSNLIQFTDNSIMEDEAITPITDVEETTNSGIDNTNKSIDKMYSISKKIQVDKYNKLYESSATKLHPKIKRYFFEQRKDILKLMNTKSYKDANKYTLLNDINKYFNSPNNRNTLDNVIKDIQVDITVDAIGYADGIIGTEATNITTISDRVIQARKNYIKDVDDVTYSQIRSTIVEGISKGDTMDMLSDRVKKVFNTSNYRSNVISHSESSSLINMSAQERYIEAGVKKKSWSTARSRESHAANHAQGPINFNETFQNGQLYPCDGSMGPGENVNCGCCLIVEEV